MESDKPKKVDKRSETSKKNMEKARLKILEERRQAKQTSQYEIESSDSDSDSGSEEPVIMIRNKGSNLYGKGKVKEAKPIVKPIAKPNENDNLKGEIQQLKQMILGMGSTKKKDKKKKRVIQILPPAQIPTPQQAPAPVKQSDDLSKVLRHRILNF